MRLKFPVAGAKQSYYCCCCGTTTCDQLCPTPRSSFTLTVSGFVANNSPFFCSLTCDGCNPVHKCDCTDLNGTYLLSLSADCQWTKFRHYAFDCCQQNGICDHDTLCVDVNAMLAIVIDECARKAAWSLSFGGTAAVDTEMIMNFDDHTFQYSLLTDYVDIASFDCSSVPAFTSISRPSPFGCQLPSPSTFSVS